MHLLSAWDGTPIVDAHASVGLELTNHYRQPKTLNSGNKLIVAEMASVRDPKGPL